MYLINGLFLFTRKFPKANQAEVSEDGKILNQKKFISEPILKKEGLAIIIIGFTSNAIYTVFCKSFANIKTEIRDPIL